MTTSADWWGTSEGTAVPTMGLDDLDLENRTLELARREEDLQAESEDLDERLSAATAIAADGYGEGKAARGAVTVRVDSQQRVIDIQLTPRALHMGSTEGLREALLDAIDAACDDMAQKLAEAGGVPRDFSPIQSFIEAIPEVAAVLPAALRTPPPVARRAISDPPDDSTTDAEEGDA